MKIALVGNPNSGKSSIFNHLTGLRQKTGNFPGVTVDKRSGRTILHNGQTAEVIDLPGAYSLYPNSSDERIVTEILCNRNNDSFPDLVIYIADANNLERQLLLCSQMIDLEIPVVLVLTMTDIAEKNGVYCDSKELSKSLDIPVVKVNGRNGEGLNDLLLIISESQRKPQRFYQVNELAPSVIDKISYILKSPGENMISPAQEQDGINDYSLLLTAHHFKNFDFIQQHQKKEIENVIQQYSFNSIQLQVKETLSRFDKISGILKKAVTQKASATANTFTENIDKLLTHPVLGSLVFMAILFLLFQAIFSWASYPMSWIDSALSELSLFIESSLPDGVINNLVSKGIIPGLAGVLIFIPQIAILFAVIAFMEDVGYMSRAIFLSDNIMRKFGLSGRSMVSLFSGLACAVPAIMAARSITNRKERIITVMITPLISCSARLPVFTILVALAVPKESFFIVFNLQGIVMMSLYLLGITTALASALVLKKIIKSTEQGHLIMELPSYKTPHWKNIAFTAWDKVNVFVTQAGKVIMVISLILWILSSYGPANKMKEAEQSVLDGNTTLAKDQKENLIAARKLQASYAGELGKLIEPVIRPLGFDWKIGIALLTSFAAREVFVGTISTLYSIGSDGNNQTILEKLRNEVNPSTGQLTFTPAVAISLLIFYVFAMQCMSTFAVVKRETNSWKWPIAQVIYMTALAYLGSLISYQVLS